MVNNLVFVLVVFLSPQSTRSNTEFLIFIPPCHPDDRREEDELLRARPKNFGNIHFSLYFSLSLIQRKGNKRKIKCYGSVAIRVKPLVNGTSTRLFKAQTASSLLTPGKTLTHATTPRHEVLPTILPFGKVTETIRKVH